MILIGCPMFLRIYQLLLYWGVKLPFCECPVYDTKLSDGEASVLELWWMWSTPSLPLHSVPLWPGVIILVRVPSMGLMEIFNHLLYLEPFNCRNIWVMLKKLLVLNSNTWNQLTVCKQMSFDSFKNNVTYRLIIYI